MPSKTRAHEVAEVDEFLLVQKHLKGSHPQWNGNSRGELEARWIIADINGVESAHFRFRVSRDRTHPAVSIVFKNQPIWRFDLVPPSECKRNLPGAYDLGLPDRVCGNHQHTWNDNRQHVLLSVWELPYRRPAFAGLHKLSQCYQALAADLNIKLLPEQYGFDVPPKTDLF